MTDVRPLSATPLRPPAAVQPWGADVAPKPPVAAAQREARIRLWLPLTPLFVLLSPFALLLAPLLALAPPLRGVSPYRAVLALGAVLLSLSGTVVEVRAPGADIRLRFF